MISPKIYEKENENVVVGDKFMYCSTVYRLLKGRAEMLEEKYYSSNKPIEIKKKDLKQKTKDFILFRFIDLIQAPEEYLLTNHYKKL